MYYKCYDMRYIFHVMRLLHLIHLIQSAHFVCFGHKSRPLKNSVYPKQVRYTRQQTKQRIEPNTCILLHNMLYYSSILMYHEIIIKSFARPTVIILCRL